MCSHSARGRVLLLAGGQRRAELRDLFAHAPLAGWSTEDASSAEQARFALQGQRHAAVVMLAGPDSADDLAALRWLALETPVVLLADADPGLVEQGFRHGASLWLPPALVRARPELLAAALGQLARRAEEDVLSKHKLREAEERVRHLLELLWEAVPAEASGPWYTQRHMMQRLEEEVGRALRQGGPLAVVLGELSSETSLPPERGRDVAAWTAQRVGQVKRRCDVAGRYGLRGFMMVLPQGNLAEAAGVCLRLRPLLETKAEGPRPPLRACFGIASAGHDPVSVKGLLARAEERLARAREQGGGVVAQPGEADSLAADHSRD